MSVERDIRYDLIARLCPNATGAELKSVATEVSADAPLVCNNALNDLTGWDVRYPVTTEGCERARLPGCGGESHSAGYQILEYSAVCAVQLVFARHESIA